MREGEATLSQSEHPGDEAKLTASAEPATRLSQTWELKAAEIFAQQQREHETWKVTDLSREHPGRRVTRERQVIPYSAVSI